MVGCEDGHRGNLGSGSRHFCYITFISNIVRVVPIGFYNRIPIGANIAVYYGEPQDCLELRFASIVVLTPTLDERKSYV